MSTIINTLPLQKYWNSFEGLQLEIFFILRVTNNYLYNTFRILIFTTNEEVSIEVSIYHPAFKYFLCTLEYEGVS